MIYLNKIWHAKVVEPKKRNKDGMRWIVHRFPIKGGISLRQAMLLDMFRPHPLWKMIVMKEAK